MDLSSDAPTVEIENKMDQQLQISDVPITTISNPITTKTTEANTCTGGNTLVNSDSTSLTTQPGISYASAFRSTGAVPKKVQAKPNKTKAKESFWTEQFQRIVAYHNQGSRVLVLMRGVPGSGKTYLAEKIVTATIGTSLVDYKTHICSTDDFFMATGAYIYERQRLSEAHDWNQSRVRTALQQGLSPVIVDNTNVETWEMEPYLKYGVRNGYFIEVMEPNTPWAKKFNQLIMRNSHNVPPNTIRKMLNNFQSVLTVEFLIKQYGLSYSVDMVPPVMRTVPAYYPPQTGASVHGLGPTAVNFAHLYVTDNLQATPQTTRTEDHNPSPTFVTEPKTITENLFDSPKQDLADCLVTDRTNKESSDEEEANGLSEIEKKLAEFQKVEQEWENGEAWDETKGTTPSIDNTVYVDPKPPRNYHNSEGSTPRDNLLVTAVRSCDDWRQMSLYLPPWNNDSFSQKSESPVDVKTQSTGTSVEIGDGNLQNPTKILKVVTAVPRDINLFYISPHREKIPDKRTLDKSTMTTNDDMMTTNENEEKHFRDFRKLFKNIPKVALRDVFDKCCGDVNWAVDIVLGGMADNQLQIMNNAAETSDDEKENTEQCACVADSNVEPVTGDSPKVCKNVERNIVKATRNSVIVPAKKMKVIPSESAAVAELKRQIEMNVVISDDHYSEQLQKIRKIRRGEFQLDNPAEQDIHHQANIRNESAMVFDTQYTQHNISKTEVANCRSDDDVSCCSSSDELDKTVNINFGTEFLSQLDNLFGRTGLTYPENVKPKINIPMSLLLEINAFWLESLMHQLNDQDDQKSKMIQEDEEFAR